MEASVNVLRSLRQCLGDNHKYVPLHEPYFCGLEQDLVLDCVKSGWVSSVGKYVDQFEEELARFCGVERAVAVVNGTAALHVCLILVGVEAGEEVIMPSLTFVATANAAHTIGAVPHFVDSERATMGIDPIKLDQHLAKIASYKSGKVINRQTGRRIAAIVPMHTLGHPVEMDAVVGIGEKYNIPVVEDAAESLGSYYKGKHTGGFGKVAAMSFNGNKIITTGGGGAILTNDSILADKAKHFTTTAKVNHTWKFEHDEKGFNYRMPNLNAALGVAQLKQLPTFLESKRSLADRYEEVFEFVSGVNWVREPHDCSSNYWLNAIELVNKPIAERDAVLDLCNKSGFMVRPLWTPMHRLEIYSDSPRSMDLGVCEKLADSVICLPSGAAISL